MKRKLNMEEMVALQVLQEVADTLYMISHEMEDQLDEKMANYLRDQCLRCAEAEKVLQPLTESLTREETFLVAIKRTARYLGYNPESLYQQVIEHRKSLELALGVVEKEERP